MHIYLHDALRDVPDNFWIKRFNVTRGFSLERIYISCYYAREAHFVKFYQQYCSSDFHVSKQRTILGLILPQKLKTVG